MSRILNADGQDLSDNKQFAGGSMFGAKAEEELQAKLDETVQMTRRELVLIIEEHVLSINKTMQAQFNSQEQQIVALEDDNLKLRRHITSLQYKLQ